MKKTIFLLIFSLLFLTIFAQDEQPEQARDLPIAANLYEREKNPEANFPVSVEYPHENMVYPEGSKGALIFGSIANPQAKLTINDLPVTVYKTGGFLAFVPLGEGDFKFILDVDDGENKYSAARKVYVKYTDTSKFKQAQFEPAKLSPQSDLWVATGDNIVLAAYGMPGSAVTATVAGLKNAKNIVLKEEKPGYYRASYKVTEEDKAALAKVTYRIKNEETDTKDKKTAKGRVKILSVKDKYYAQIKNKASRIRQLPVTQGSLFPFYNMYDTLKISGKVDNMYRLDLDGGHYGWIEGAKIKIVNKPAALNSISTVTTENMETKTRIIFYGKKEVPLLTKSSAQFFEITLFNTDSNIPVIEAPVSPIVKDIVVENITDTVTAFKMNYNENQMLWGFDYSFENGNLVLDLIHKPVLTPEKGLPLKGAVIMLDPGHSPRRRPQYDGAIGPTGALEYELNMRIVKELEPMLSKLGAKVLVTKNEKEQLNLTGRVARTLEQNAHILISVHHNALPQTANPYAGKRGFTMYYFHDHSMALAKALNRGFSKNIQLPDNGTLRGDFYMVRPYQLPSVITENAFIMFPEQEEMAVAQREKFVKAIYDGILDFYGVKIEEPKPAAAPVKKAVKASSKKAVKKTNKKTAKKK